MSYYINNTMSIGSDPFDPYAAQGLGTRSWHMKRQKLSARPTTRWDELMTVR